MRILLPGLFLIGAFSVAAPAVSPSDIWSRKLLIAHRGASAYAPEHTRAAYELAIEQGADFVEQDLGVTRDGVLVCLHDPTLERTTNVEDVFPDRFTESGGRRRWFVGDFTLAEIRRLDAGSWRGAEFSGERIPTWDEVIVIVRGRAGLIPELKRPDLYRAGGTDPARLFVDSLRRNGLLDRDARTPVVVQSFDAQTLRSLTESIPDIARVFLLEPAAAREWLTPERIGGIAAFATAVGPSKAAIDGRPELVRLAHGAGLKVVPYTFRAGGTGRFPDVEAEMRHYLVDLDVDGVFTDNPDRFPRVLRGPAAGRN
jgi:glycerophosphoryl diester phosphodiesterase